MTRADNDLTIISEASRKCLVTDSRQSYLPQVSSTSWANHHHLFLADNFVRHFGREIISGHLHIPSNDPKVDTLWLKLYKVLFILPHSGHTLIASQEFIEAIDGIDNGISQYPNDIQPKYRNRTDLSTRVGWLNPAWNEPVDSQTVDVRSFIYALRAHVNVFVRHNF